tara:strand:+ start:364 stop:567 length:204 start_codon:yes stop_codon:yes gene_type:complete
MEAGKRRLAGSTARATTTDEVKDLRREASALKECVADLLCCSPDTSGQTHTNWRLLPVSAYSPDLRL